MARGAILFSGICGHKTPLQLFERKHNMSVAEQHESTVHLWTFLKNDTLHSNKHADNHDHNVKTCDQCIWEFNNIGGTMKNSKWYTHLQGTLNTRIVALMNAVFKTVAFIPRVIWFVIETVVQLLMTPFAFCKLERSQFKNESKQVVQERAADLVDILCDVIEIPLSCINALIAPEIGCMLRFKYVFGLRYALTPWRITAVTKTTDKHFNWRRLRFEDTK